MFNFFGRHKKPIPLWFSTDIHCHLLPGIDDGAQNASCAVDLIERMQSWGIKHIIASPHVTSDTFENRPDRMARAFQRLKTELANRGNEIDIDYSAEYRMDGFFLEQIKDDALRPYPKNYLLVENSYENETFNIEEFVRDLRRRGYRTILAHPERYPYYFENRARYKQLSAMGLYFQVNILSLAGFYGKDVKKVAEFLLERNLIDFIGTDLHSYAHADAIDRYLRSKDARRHRDLLQRRILNDQIRK